MMMVGLGAMKFGFLFTIFLPSVFFASPLLDPPDYLSLQMIQKNLSGSDFFVNWNFNVGDLCNFNGVSCSEDQTEVYKLYLGPYLSGRLDPPFLILPSLSELAVDPGNISGSPLDWLSSPLTNLSSLTLLSITGNRFSGGIPPSIASLRNLRKLDLSCNRLTGSIPWQIGGLPALTSLVLSGNRLSGSVPVFYSPNLLTVDLNDNYLSGPLPSNAFPPSLNSLSLPRNRLTSTVHQALSGLNNLTFLDLGFNDFSGYIPANLFCPPMETLLLDGNRFAGSLPQSPACAVNIATVDLSYNRLSGKIPPCFSAAKSLAMNNNRFTGEIPGEFVDRVLSSEMKRLFLQHNSLTGIKVNQTAAADFQAKGSVCLEGNPIVTPPPVIDDACTSEPNPGRQRRPTELCQVPNQ
ncbi:unnamed protein product [Cuscuta campestris]|uniref:Leucine-rich repeat-containing N-terminal plant-type domain-containing protein n=1 Tax=Cuscuta campestris TaxID=132261 RepID=A0A484MDY1_9ASTE|nr:unnamed protein product [Cuscuta campestris]